MTPYTIWQFKSIDGKQCVTVIRPTYPGEEQYQNEYDRILWSGAANNREHALAQYKAGK